VFNNLLQPPGHAVGQLPQVLLGGVEHPELVDLLQDGDRGDGHLLQLVLHDVSHIFNWV
jgi:hypothetical protein